MGGVYQIDAQLEHYSPRRKCCKRTTKVIIQYFDKPINSFVVYKAAVRRKTLLDSSTVAYNVEVLNQLKNPVLNAKPHYSRLVPSMCHDNRYRNKRDSTQGFLLLHVFKYFTKGNSPLFYKNILFTFNRAVSYADIILHKIFKSSELHYLMIFVCKLRVVPQPSST